MINFDFSAECCGCSVCAQLCPQKCIVMEENAEGFLVPSVDKTKCVNCGLCEKSCPVLNAKPEVLTEDNVPSEVYAAYNKNEEARMKSTSGGIFIMLAEYVLNRGGVVFGARFSDDCHFVYHCSAENIEEVWRFSGSKYLQSDVKNTYCEAKSFLEKGRIVLYTGTPCQIEGLRAFLRKDYENLICMDFICNSVSSPKVWRKYVEYIESKYSKIKAAYFRNKCSRGGGGN